jgi:DNA repair protein RadC
MPLRLKIALEEARKEYEPDSGSTHFIRSVPEVAGEVVAALRDEDVLVVLLHNVVPWEQAFNLSRDLMMQFGSFTALINADTTKLKKVPTINSSIIGILMAVREASIRLAKNDIIDAPVLGNEIALKRYLQSNIGRKAVEEVRILLLNAKNMLIEDWQHSRGTVNEAPFYVREIIRKAVDVNSTAIIVVHNHPSGDVTPSEADIFYTKKLQTAAAAVDLVLHDHIIVSSSKVASFRALGLL